MDGATEHRSTRSNTHPMENNDRHRIKRIMLPEARMTPNGKTGAIVPASLKPGTAHFPAEALAGLFV